MDEWKCLFWWGFMLVRLREGKGRDWVGSMCVCVDGWIVVPGLRACFNEFYLLLLEGSKRDGCGE